MDGSPRTYRHRFDGLSNSLMCFVLVCLLSCCCTPSGSSETQSPADRPPNFVFIMADDHASHALSAYFRKDVLDKLETPRTQINETPNLDRLADEGVVFTHAFCTNSICSPARATILTGKYSHKNRLTHNWIPFDAGQQTFPKLLQQAGYQTALIGKWHLQASDAVDAGFDFAKTLSGLLGQGTYYDPKLGGETIEGYTTDIITDQAIAWLQNGRDENRPFYLSIHHKAPHRNWESDEAHQDLYVGETIPTPATFNDDYSTRSSAAQMARMKIAEDLTELDYKLPIPPGLTPQEEKEFKQQAWIKDYLRTIASIDDNVGRLLDYLDTSGLRENTIVLYTSDQGFFLGDHGWFDKRFMYEESLRIPLIVRFPAEIAPGTVEDHMVLNVDFAPTFLDYAGIEIPSDMQGRSFRPLLEGQEPSDWRTSMYYRYYEEFGPPLGHSVSMHYGVRTDRYKLIYYNKLNEWELFDLQSDPYELVNVYSDPAYANVVGELKTELDDLRTGLDDNDEAVWMMSVAGASHGAKGTIIRLPIHLIFIGLLTVVGSLSFIWRCCPGVLLARRISRSKRSIG